MRELQEQAIRQHCKTLRMPTIGHQFARLAEAAVREGQSHIGYLEALLNAEMEERESRAIVNRSAKGTPDRRPIGTPFVTDCMNLVMFLGSADRGCFFAPA